MEKIINLWKELGVTHINFEYSCGGDSMNDTTLNIHKGDEIIENDELDSYFDSEVYKRVEFYVNSDGHYQGESGNVLIELNDEGDDFNFMKSGTSEYNESITSTLEIDLTEDEIAFLKEYVSDINGGESDRTNLNYKKDFILTPKKEELVKNIIQKVDDMCSNFTPDIEEGGDLNDWFSFTTNEDDISDEDEIRFVDNKMLVTITNQYYVFINDEN